MTDVLDLPCPNCGGEVTYNGNYYCLDEVTCRWGLRESDDVQPWVRSLLRARGTSRKRRET